MFRVFEQVSKQLSMYLPQRVKTNIKSVGATTHLKFKQQVVKVMVVSCRFLQATYNRMLRLRIGVKYTKNFLYMSCAQFMMQYLVYSVCRRIKMVYETCLDYISLTTIWANTIQKSCSKRSRSQDTLNRKSTTCLDGLPK